MSGCHKDKNWMLQSLKRSAPEPTTKSMMPNWLKLKPKRFQAQVPAAACITSNTMASAIEALGMSLPGSSAQAAISNDKRLDYERTDAAVLELLKYSLNPE